MTQGNRKRLEYIIKQLEDLVSSDPEAKQHDAQGLGLILLQSITNLNVILQDLILRPEVNS